MKRHLVQYKNFWRSYRSNTWLAVKGLKKQIPFRSSPGGSTPHNAINLSTFSRTVWNSSISSIRWTKLSSASFSSTPDVVFKSSKNVALCSWTRSKTSTVTEPSDIILTRASSNNLAWNNFSWPVGESMPPLPDSSPVKWNNQLQCTHYEVLETEIEVFSLFESFTLPRFWFFSYICFPVL